MAEAADAIRRTLSFDVNDAVFRLECGLTEEASRHVIARRALLNGDFYSSLPACAKIRGQKVGRGRHGDLPRTHGIDPVAGGIKDLSPCRAILAPPGEALFRHRRVGRRGSARRVCRASSHTAPAEVIVLEARGWVIGMINTNFVKSLDM